MFAACCPLASGFTQGSARLSKSHASAGPRKVMLFFGEGWGKDRSFLELPIPAKSLVP